MVILLGDRFIDDKLLKLEKELDHPAMMQRLKGKPYEYGKDEILKTLETMLQSASFEFEERSAVYQALQHTKQGKADFSDYLIGAIARQVGCDETATFDRRLKDEKGFYCLG